MLANFEALARNAKGNQSDRIILFHDKVSKIANLGFLQVVPQRRRDDLIGGRKLSPRMNEWMSMGKGGGGDEAYF